MTTVFLWLFLLWLAAMIVLDVAMIVSLVRVGDERRQMIVLKASAVTLVGTAGSQVFRIVEALATGSRMEANPFVTLSVMAMVYFVCLLYYKKRYGD